MSASSYGSRCGVTRDTGTGLRGESTHRAAAYGGNPEARSGNLPTRAMPPRKWVIAGAALILGFIVTWTLIPPFPSSLLLLDESLPSLTARYGPPNGRIGASALGKDTSSLRWDKPRGIGLWSLEIGWDKTPAGTTILPDFASQSLRVLGTTVSFPRDAAVRGSILASARQSELSR